MRLQLPSLCSVVGSSSNRIARNGLRRAALGLLTAAGLLAAANSAGAQGLVFDPTITTYAGNGSLTNNNSGNGGPATAAGLNNPEGIAYDSRGNTYIADYNNNTIRIVNSAGIINAFAGSGGQCAAAANAACGDNGPASAALFYHPSAMQFDTQGNLFIADYNANRVRKITATNGIITSASIVTTVAGTGAAAATTSNTAATAATLNGPHGLALDAAGDLWIINQLSCEVDYVPATAQTITIGGTATNLTAGNIYVVAGTGTCGGGGSGTVGSTTQLNGPTNGALDAANNLYIGDYSNGKVRKLVTSSGVISTLAGTTQGACPVNAPTTGQPPAATPACGDGGVATSATLNGPTGVYIDGAGNIIIGDAFGARVREIYGPNSTVGTPGNITTIAGTSQQCTNINQNQTFSYNNSILNFPNCGDGGPATQALVSFPILISVNPQGNILYVDQYDNKIREINENTIFPPTNVGSSSTAQNVDVQTIGAGSTTITSVTSSSPQFTVAATTGCTLNAATATNTVCTTPVTFTPQYPGIQTAVIKFVTSAGTYTYGVVGTGVAPEAVTSPGLLSTVAGTGVAGLTNGAATASTLNGPVGPIAFDSQGDYFIADTANNVVREVNAQGTMSTFAGTGTAGYTGDNGQATAATLKGPQGVAVDASGNVYISDSGNNVVRQVSTTGVITTFITGLTNPGGLVVNPITQALYIADTGTNTVRQYSAATRSLTLVVGTGTACTPSTSACGDNASALAANLNKPTGVAFDASGNLFIADSGDNRIREVTTSNGTITTVAGTGTAAYTGDKGAALSATLNNPSSLVLDAAGDIYIADQNNNVIRFVGGGTNNISTLVGNGTACTTVPSPACGDGGPANVSALSGPRGVAVDNLGNVYITETATNRIREAAATGTKLTFASTQVGTTSADSPQTALLENIGNAALTLSVPTSGTNPSISAGFTDSNTATCPQLTTSSTAGSLAAGTQCTYLVSFTPTIVGAYTGSLVEKDNSLNVASSQTVALAGTSTVDYPSVTLNTSPNPSTYGGPVTLSSTVTSPGIAPTGSVTFYSVGATQNVNLSVASVAAASQTLNLQPGTYSVAIIGTTNGGQYAAWAPATPAAGNWTDRYGIEQCATCASTIENLNGNPGYATNTAAYTAFSSSPYLTDGTNTSGNPFTFTLTAPQAVSFFIPDGTFQNGAFVNGSTSFGDDSGGLSLSVTMLSAIGTGLLGANGNAATTATLVTPNLPVGTTPIIGIYNGDGNNVSTESPIVNQVVNKAPVNNTVTPALSQSFSATPSSINAGATETLTYTVPSVSGNTPPTGPVVFSSPGLATPITCSSFVAGATVAAAGTTPAYTPYTCTATTTALQVGNPDVITATYTANDPNYANTPALTQNVVVSQSGATNSLTATPQSTSYGTPVLLTETIAPINNTCPAGPATFLNGGNSIGTGAITLQNGSCIATLTTYNLPVGTNQISATVPTSGNFTAITSGPIPVTIAKAPVTNGTTPALSQIFSATPSTINAGAQETLTYTVPVASGNAAPTGPVVFSSPGLATPITCSSFVAGTPVAASGNTPPYTPYTCTSTTTLLQVGNPDVITATYSANDPNYANSPALTQNVVVNATNATNSLTATPQSTSYGTPVLLTETIAPINNTCPAGPATFKNGANTLGTGAISLQNGSCIATLTTYNLPVGTNQISATVPASGYFAAITSGPIPVTIAKAPVTNGTTPVLSQSFSATPSTINAGGQETLTYTVPVASGNAAPTGPVVFSSPGLATPITCSTFVAGTPVTGTTPPYTPYTCTSTTTALQVGNPDVITATYSANDPNYANSPALTQNVVVNASNATNSLTATPQSTSYGTPVLLTETIAPINGTCPAGPATFLNGANTLGTGAITLQNGSCIATLTTYNLPVGTNQISATVPTSGNFTAITTGPIPVTISKAPVTNGTTPVLSQTFSATPGTINAGATETFVYTVPVASGNAAPTGPVVFSSPGLATPITCSTFVAGTPVTGTTPPYTPYTCTSTTTLLQVGNPDVVTATYSANDPNYANSPALTQNVVVNAANATNSLTATPQTTTYGSPVLLTETIAPVNGTCPAGPATFKNGATTLGTGPITLQNGSCIATLTTYNLPVGVNQLTATVPASGYFAAITSGPIPVTIAKAPVNNGTTPVLSQTFSATPASVSAGAAVTLTYTVPVAAGNTAPTGPVVFSSPALATPITCSNFTAGGAVASSGNAPAYTAYTCTSTTTALAVGNPDVITATYTANDPNYANTPALTQNVVVAAVTPVSVITVPPGTPGCGTSVTLTDTITAVNGIPLVGGTVQFYDNGVPIGSPIPVPANGVVTFTTTALACTTNVITAIYTPPAGSPYLPSPAPPVTVNIGADFSIAATPPTQVVNPGDTVVYTVSLSGVGGAFNAPVTLTATGLPKDATVTFGNPTYVPGVGPTSTTMTIVTSPYHAELRRFGGASNIAYGLLLLPLLGVRRIRRRLKSLPRGVLYGIAGLLLLAGLGAVTGCGGGYIGPNPGFYTITVTGTSGNLVHSTTVQLEVR